MTSLHRLETTEPKNPNLKLIEAIAVDHERLSQGWMLRGSRVRRSLHSEFMAPRFVFRVIEIVELSGLALLDRR